MKSEVKLTSPPYFTSVKLTEVKSQCGLKYSCKRYTRSELKSLLCYVNNINVKILVTRVYFCYYICFALQLISRAGYILSIQLWVKKIINSNPRRNRKIIEGFGRLTWCRHLSSVCLIDYKADKAYEGFDFEAD